MAGRDWWGLLSTGLHPNSAPCLATLLGLFCTPTAPTPLDPRDFGRALIKGHVGGREGAQGACT